MSRIEKAISEYFRQTLGAMVALAPWPGASGLPPFLQDRYRVRQGRLSGHWLLFLIDQLPEEGTPATIGKHLGIVREKSEHPVVYVCERVTSYNRKRLIEHRVPFVVPGTQMYLPELGIDLREHFRSLASERAHFRPATQAVFLHVLLEGSDRSFGASELAPRLGYSAMTLSRAFDEIVTAELGVTGVIGRERMLRLTTERKATWQRAQPFLSSPVLEKKFVLVKKAIPGLRAGLSALAAYSMLAEPPYMVHALSREDWKALAARRDVILVPMREPNVHEVEVWKYLPRESVVRGVVEPLSLALSLRESADERVEQGVARMMEALPW